MKWPWISRRAFDMVVEERDRLRIVNDDLTMHLTRMDRTEHGLAEVPRPAKKQLDPVPEAITAYCKGFASPAVQKELLREAKRRRRDGQGWDGILLDIQEEETTASVVP